MNKRTWVLIGLLLLGIILLAYPVAAQHPQSAIYFDDGGDRLTVASGGVFSAAPGSAFTVTNLTARGALVVDGLTTMTGGYSCADFVLENGETIDNSQNDMITFTVAATGQVGISGGNLQVGDGNPTVAMSGDDLHVNGSVEVDGMAYLDGGVDVTGGDITLRSDEAIGNSTDGTIVMTATTVSLTGGVSVSGGDVTLRSGEAIGNSTNNTIAVTATTLSLTGGLLVATWDDMTVQAALALTNDTEIVPTGYYQPVYVTSGTAGIGTASITTTGMTQGRRVLLYNIGTPTVTITDTTGVTLTADIGLTRDSNLEIMFNGNGWVETHHAVNN